MPVLLRQIAQFITPDTIPNILFQNSQGPVITIESIFICNTTASAATFSLWFDLSGSATADLNALYKDFALPASSTIRLDRAPILYMRANSTLTCQASHATTFTLFGQEIS